MAILPDWGVSSSLGSSKPSIVYDSARFSGDLGSSRLDLCMQTLSVALHRANARSILTRPFHTPQPVNAPAVFARATLTAAQAQQAAHTHSISEQMAF